MEQSFNPLEWLTCYLIAINLIAFACFGIDKALAEAQSGRISEATLLMWAFVGGTPGAYAGRQLFRHKTRKQPFSRHLHFIAVLQAFVIITGSVMGWGNFIAMLRSVAG